MGIKKFAAGFLVAAFASVAATAQTAPTQAQPMTGPVVHQAQSNGAASEVRYFNELHLAYIISPDARENDVTRRGMERLAHELGRKTAVVPQGVVGLDLEHDDLTPFPFIYWPVVSIENQISERAQQKVQSYINNGGVFLIDIKDLNARIGDRNSLRQKLGAVNLQRLVPMPEDHTLTKTFYLMSNLRGSQNYETIWVQEPGEEGALENVSSVIIGDNNWSAAWAGVTLRGNNREQDMAMRAGINIVVYALTGNYKSDQVHIPSILERLERR